MVKRCKHAIIESYWNTSLGEDGKEQEFDKFGENKTPHSFLGIWSKPYPGPICGFLGKADKQFEKRMGFFYCDETKCLDCEFYESDETNKNIKLNYNGKRNPLPHNIRHEVFKKDNYRCVECSTTKDKNTLHIDHIIPISRGGSDELDNLQTLCETCNLSKTNMIFKK